jgi:hypothetical protein
VKSVFFPDLTSALICSPAIDCSPKNDEARREIRIFMAPTRLLTTIAVSLICAAQISTGFAQDKKKAGGGGADAAAKRAAELAAAGALDEALVEYNKAVEAAPKQARLYNERGGLYLAQKKFTRRLLISRRRWN